MKIYAKKGDKVKLVKPLNAIGFVGVEKGFIATITEITIHKPEKYFSGMVIYSIEVQIHTKKGLCNRRANFLNGSFEKGFVIKI